MFLCLYSYSIFPSHISVTTTPSKWGYEIVTTPKLHIRHWELQKSFTWGIWWIKIKQTPDLNIWPKFCSACWNLEHPSPSPGRPIFRKSERDWTTVKFRNYKGSLINRFEHKLIFLWFAFCKAVWPLVREDLSLSFVPSSNFFTRSRDPWRAFWADTASLKGPQPRPSCVARNKDNFSCVAPARRAHCTKENKPGARRPWSCICKKHIFCTLILDC